MRTVKVKTCGQDFINLTEIFGIPGWEHLSSRRVLKAQSPVSPALSTTWHLLRRLVAMGRAKAESLSGLPSHISVVTSIPAASISAMSQVTCRSSCCFSCCYLLSNSVCHSPAPMPGDSSAIVKGSSPDSNTVRAHRCISPPFARPVATLLAISTWGEKSPAKKMRLTMISSPFHGCRRYHGFGRCLCNCTEVLSCPVFEFEVTYQENDLENW